MNRIVVATDGSADGQGAVHWAADLAAAAHTELVVATAWHPMFSEVSPDEYRDLRDEAQRQLDDEWAAPARRAGVAVQTLLLDGDPRDAIPPGVAEAHGDLVVVGARGTGGRHHALHLGSVTHHLVHHTEVPLAAIPASARTSWPTTILVGLDGSDNSRRALAWAEELARQTESDIVAAYAELQVAEWVPHSDPLSWYQRAVKNLDEWVGAAAPGRPPIRTLVVNHDPASGLAEAASRERAGLVVVGTRGIGQVTGVRLGGTALKVLHHAGMPVVVVPPTS